mmetsp:Transcript_43846/g.113217  ORF Transcript_43846/g.113217 Transcript_43846/m.113217 type:complete len:225 (+) Transcript_43846:190-864(+)
MGPRSLEVLVAAGVEEAVLLLVRPVPAVLDARVRARHAGVARRLGLHAAGAAALGLGCVALHLRHHRGCRAHPLLQGVASVLLGLDMTEGLELAARLQAVQQVSARPALEPHVEARHADVADGMDTRDALVHAVNRTRRRECPRVKGIIRRQQPERVGEGRLARLGVRELVRVHRHQELLIDPLLQIEERLEAVEAAAVRLTVVGQVQLHEDRIRRHRQLHRHR